MWPRAFRRQLQPNLLSGLARSCGGGRSFALSPLSSGSEASAAAAAAAAAAATTRPALRAAAPAIRVVPLSPELVGAAIECVAESFGGSPLNDPFSWLFNLKRHHWHAMTAPFIERAAAAGAPRLSVVALDAATGRVDGVMVNEDWTTPRPAAYRSRLSSDWWPVRAAFADLHARFVEARPGIERGSTIRCMYFSCVRPQARGQGVMRGLWRGTVEAAREHGYSHITAQASTEAVRQVLHQQLGFAEVASVRFADWEYYADDERDGAGGAGGAGGGGNWGGSGSGGRRPSRVLAELLDFDPAQGTDGRLSISVRKVPSNLYV